MTAQPQHAALVDMMVADLTGYDVIQVAPIARAYSLARDTAPDLVVLLLTIDDVKACQLLSMLATDGLTSHIPVLSCTFDPQSVVDQILFDVTADTPTPVIGIEQN